ncbi:androgen-induced gene 1 protein isoform 2-T2 [Menidia menidia]
MALIPSQVLRVAILLSYFSILCHYKALDMPAHQTYGGSWKFLTFIDLVIQAGFFGLCVLMVLLGSAVVLLVAGDPGGVLRAVRADWFC